MPRPKGYRLSRSAWDDLIVDAKKLTVTEVAAITGINRASISGLITGNTRASLTMARELAEGLDVRAETLFPLLDRSIVVDLEAA